MDMFKRIFLITNSGATEVADTLNSLIEFLQKLKIQIILDKSCAQIANNKDLPVATDEKPGPNTDLAIAIGGDGTMLKAAHLVCNHEIPLLGINRGHLGFLADIPADAVFQHLNEIFKGHYAEDERFLLHSQIFRDGNLLQEGNAFNDIILHKWNIARLVEFETYVDDIFVHKQRSDGIIISTPTGSTAYALSGGGPILFPSLDAMVLVPICPHSLTNRPIVINGNSKVEIVVGTREIDHARLTCDGDVAYELAPGDRVRIHKKDKKIRLIHPANYDHFSMLRAKLRWG
ncbi:MAG: NAD(+) kinase [Gammaproteobacteria bacterium]|nr:NAD(+) kinase [Gammaproteobacteria bacterium]